MTEHVTSYVQLIWLFAGIITVLMLFLCYLYLAMRRVQKLEEESFEFSRLIIEGQERERQRITRELHDGVLPLVQNTDVSGIIRSICMDLIPPNFEHLSLTDSFSDLCTHFSLRSGIECVHSIEDDVDFSMISSEHQLHLYRMVQESFTNIEKYSGAKKAVLVVRHYSETPGHILICISDDGAGLSSASKESAGLGMKSMRQRADILGAKLDFNSESGEGLMVRIELMMNK
jgi:two-component system NarL family sensor kinase